MFNFDCMNRYDRMISEGEITDPETIELIDGAWVAVETIDSMAFFELKERIEARLTVQS